MRLGYGGGFVRQKEDANTLSLFPLANGKYGDTVGRGSDINGRLRVRQD